MAPIEILYIRTNRKVPIVAAFHRSVRDIRQRSRIRSQRSEHVMPFFNEKGKACVGKVQ